MKPKKYRKERRFETPPWLDSVILWLEFIGMIALLAGGLYSLLEWVF